MIKKIITIYFKIYAKSKFFCVNFGRPSPNSVSVKEDQIPLGDLDSAFVTVTSKRIVIN